jgi:hypothetical protein
LETRRTNEIQTPRETLKLFLGGNRNNSGSVQTLEKTTIIFFRIFETSP